MLKTQLIGRLGADAEVKTLQNGSKVMELRIAVDMSYRNKDGEKVDRTVWVKATQWNVKDNATIQNYLKKGGQIYVEGEPSANGYTNKDGAVVANLELKITNIQLLGGKVDQAPAPEAQKAVPMPTAATEDEPDDLPF